MEVCALAAWMKTEAVGAREAAAFEAARAPCCRGYRPAAVCPEEWVRRPRRVFVAWVGCERHLHAPPHGSTCDCKLCLYLNRGVCCASRGVLHLCAQRRTSFMRCQGWSAHSLLRSSQSHGVLSRARAECGPRGSSTGVFRHPAETPIAVPPPYTLPTERGSALHSK